MIKVEKGDVEEEKVLGGFFWWNISLSLIVSLLKAGVRLIPSLFSLLSTVNKL